MDFSAADSKLPLVFPIGTPERGRAALLSLESLLSLSRNADSPVLGAMGKAPFPDAAMRAFSGQPRRLEWACCSRRPGLGQAGRTPRALNLRVSVSPSPPPGTPAQKDAGPGRGALLRPSCLPRLPRGAPNTLLGAHGPGMVRFVPELVQGEEPGRAREI